MMHEHAQETDPLTVGFAHVPAAAIQTTPPSREPMSVWRNPDSVRALIAELQVLPAAPLLRRAIETQLTTTEDERTAWDYECSRLRMDSDGRGHGGTKWSMGSAEHLAFVNGSRRRYFIRLAEETVARQTENPGVTLDKHRTETHELLGGIIMNLRRRRPR